MRNHFLVFILSLFFYTANAQEVLVFRPFYKPNSLYKIVNTVESKNKISYFDLEENLVDLEDQGITNPTIQDDLAVKTMVIHTDHVKDGEFPVRLWLLNSVSSAGNNPVPDGTIVYGKSKLSGKLEFDSIQNANLSEDRKKLILSGFNIGLDIIGSQQRDLRIGDKFEETKTLSIPLGTDNLDLEVTSTYELIDFRNNKGILEFVQSINMKSDAGLTNMTAKGDGSGIMTYDTELDFISEYDYQANISMKMEVNGMTISVETSSDMLFKSSVMTE